MRGLRLAAAALFAVPAGARAQEADEAPICTDRPAKVNSVCTAPVGKWQLESSAFSWARTAADGTETRVLALGPSVLKLGISDRSDLQLGFAPHVSAETRAGGRSSSASGIGDLTVRYKYRLTADAAPVQVGLIPFVKLPTANDDIGNGKIEGGLAVPISIATDGAVTVVLGPELDLLADGGGHHAALVNLINVGRPLGDRIMLYAELWTMTHFDPVDTYTLATADAAAAYLANPDLQLDLGVNFGLTRHAADAELYLGLSWRF